MSDDEMALVIEEEEIEEEPEEPAGDPPWLITFGDAISLLLTFFVLLLSFSTFDDPNAVKSKISFETTRVSTGKSMLAGSRYEKFDVDHKNTELEKMMDYGEGSFKFKKETIRDESSLVKSVDKVTFTLQQLKEVIEDNQNVVEDGVAMKESTFGITFDPGIYFVENTDELLPESIPALENSLPVISEIPNDITVTTYAPEHYSLTPEEEHTKRSELSITRAERIVQYLVKGGGILPERISVTAFNPNDKEYQKRGENIRKAVISVSGSLEGYYSLLKQKKAQKIERQANGG